MELGRFLDRLLNLDWQSLILEHYGNQTNDQKGLQQVDVPFFIALLFLFELHFELFET